MFGRERAQHNEVDIQLLGALQDYLGDSNVVFGRATISP